MSRPQAPMKGKATGVGSARHPTRASPQLVIRGRVPGTHLRCPRHGPLIVDLLLEASPLTECQVRQLLRPRLLYIPDLVGKSPPGATRGVRMIRTGEAIWGGFWSSLSLCSRLVAKTKSIHVSSIHHDGAKLPSTSVTVLHVMCPSLRLCDARIIQTASVRKKWSVRHLVRLVGLDWCVSHLFANFPFHIITLGRSGVIWSNFKYM
jgi:hypothetical protein